MVEEQLRAGGIADERRARGDGRGPARGVRPEELRGRHTGTARCRSATGRRSLSLGWSPRSARRSSCGGRAGSRRRRRGGLLDGRDAAELVGPGGRVRSYELVPELADGRRNPCRLGYAQSRCWQETAATDRGEMGRDRGPCRGARSAGAARSNRFGREAGWWCRLHGAGADILTAFKRSGRRLGDEVELERTEIAAVPLRAAPRRIGFPSRGQIGSRTLTALLALNFFSPAFVDQLKRGRKTATIRLGDKSHKYQAGQVVWITVGYQHSPREKIFAAVIDEVEVKRIKDLSPRGHRARQPGVPLGRPDDRLPRADLPPRGDPRGHLHDRPLLADHRARHGTARQRRHPAPKLDRGCAMPAYRFCTTWVLEAERERVWDAIYDSDSWPEWWRGVTTPSGSPTATRTASASAASTSGAPASRTPCASRSSQPWSSGRTGSAARPRASWRDRAVALLSEGGTTAVIYDWDVRTTRPWMNLLAPVAKPIFRSNHDWVMRNGGEGLARKLGARLLLND